MRNEMVSRDIAGRGIRDPRVLAALRAVPRHEFVPEDYRGEAYADHPLPIGLGQTISQPYIVALMTELAEVKPDSRVLEVGTGSGYQAAVLNELCRDVSTIEILPELADHARATLARLGYTNVAVRIGDGYLGWPEKAPFDAILVTAAPDHVPQPLVDQLKPGGRMILPVGPSAGVQDLTLVRKGEDGILAEQTIIPVRFVPLTGHRGRSEE